MKKYTIELTEDQMRLVANCLEDVSRFASGQCELRYTTEAMLKGVSFNEFIERRKEYEPLFAQIKKVMLPHLPTNVSLGYNGTEFIGNVYQIFRSILYRLATDNNWDNVYSSPALPSGTMGTVKIEEVKNT